MDFSKKCKHTAHLAQLLDMPYPNAAFHFVLLAKRPLAHRGEGGGIRAFSKAFTR